MRIAMGLVLVVSMSVAFGQDPDPVAAKLDKATDTYKAEMKVYREKATAWLDAREAAARKSGDKKAVDRVHEEQRVFRTVSDLPKGAPEELRTRQTDAKAKLVKAYGIAVKEWTKVGEDKKAAEAEKRLAEIRAGVDLSLDRRVWVHDKGEYARVGPGQWEERKSDGSRQKFGEIDRTSEYIDITTTADGKTYIVRLTATSCSTATAAPSPVFTPSYSGKWAE